eukprot:scaffold2983_cov123-Cylindrotheca_fusiformis.AAC.1
MGDPIPAEVVLAVDIGSSSVRCSVYNVDGTHLLESSSVSVSSVHPNSGKINLLQKQEDKETNLFDLLDKCVDQTIEKARQRSDSFQVVAVGFSSFVMNLIAINKDGEFVGEDATISYACNDPSVAQECQHVSQQLGEEGREKLYQNTGAPIHSSYAIPQLRVFYRDHPDLAKQIDHWTTIASLCISRWTGKKGLAISYSEASWTGLLNFRECAYEESALSLLPTGCKEDSLPKLEDTSSSPVMIPEDFTDQASADSSKNPYWKRWPELRKASLFLGIGDGACANVGSKAVTESRIAVTIGTSAAARICLKQPMHDKDFVVPSGLFCYRIDRNHVLVGGALTDGGSVVEWASQLLNLTGKQDFQDCMTKVRKLGEEDYLESTSTPASNLSMIPFLSGERSTGFRGGATGAMVGLTRATTPAHFLKSSLEGVTLRLRAVLQLLLEARNRGPTSDLPIVMASGKALEENDLWRQMIADSSGLQVVLDPGTFEGTSRGVARLVSLALSSTRSKSGNDNGSSSLSEEELHDTSKSCPRPNAKSYFDQAAAMQDEFISTMSPFFTHSDS